MISISVVSHAQLHLIYRLLEDIRQYCDVDKIEVILTLNLVEELPFNVQDYSFVIKIIINCVPKGFGANHNAAFAQSQGDFFCVINPDVRLNQDPFSVLQQTLYQSDIGVVAPLILNKDHKIENSARKFPTPFSLLLRILRLNKALDYTITEDLLFPDWVGGMFMLLPSSVYREICGFDEHYFLYYEDVDLCARLLLSGYRTVLNPAVSVVHEAQWTSRHNFKYSRWHINSITRFFCSRVFFRVQWGCLAKPIERD